MLVGLLEVDHMHDGIGLECVCKKSKCVNEVVIKSC